MAIIDSFESLMFALVTGAGLLGVLIRYIGDYYRKAKELDLFGVDGNLPEPFRTILKLAQFNQMHNEASYQENLERVQLRIRTLETEMDSMRDLMSRVRGTCLMNHGNMDLTEKPVIQMGEQPPANP